MKREIKMYSFITKTSKGYILTIRNSFDYSQGLDISSKLYADKKSAKQAAVAANAKAWNY